MHFQCLQSTRPLSGIHRSTLQLHLAESGKIVLKNALKVAAKVKQKMLLFTPGLKTNNFRVYGLFIHVTGKQHHRDKHCHHGSPHPPLPPSPPHPHPHPPHHHHHLVPNHEIIANQMLSSDTPKLAKSFGNGMEPSGLVT